MNEIDKAAIDSASKIEYISPDGDVYIHTLEFILPYHLNFHVKRTSYAINGCSYDFYHNEFTFDKLEADIGNLGNGILKREVITSGIIYDGILYRNDEYDLLEFIQKAKTENKELYVLKYVSEKNGIKRYSKNGLLKLKEKYKEFKYDK